MKVGFTGSQHGMHDEQRNSFIRFISKSPMILDIREFHHGDCIGADEEANIIVFRRLRNVVRILHPGNIEQKRAYCHGTVVHDPLPTLTRNKIIVDSTNLLIATPRQSHEILRSGTWSTVRYARRRRKAIVIIQPNGTRIHEPGVDQKCSNDLRFFIEKK